MAIIDLFATLSLQTAYLGNTMFQYLIFFSIIIGGIIVGKILNFITKSFLKVLARKSKTMIDDIIVDSLDAPAVFLVFIISLFIGYNTLTLSEDTGTLFMNIMSILLILNVAWFLVRLIDAIIKHYVIPFSKRSDTELDDVLIPIIRKLVKFVVAAIAVIMIIDKFGYDVTSIIAGLGIGGLAFALAAKDTLGHIFGGTTILLDKPFKLGQRIKFETYDGHVEEIGLRSTKVRTLDGSELIVPNSTIANAVLENVTREKRRRVNTVLGLVYDTSTTKMKKAVNLLKKITKDQKGVQNEAKVYFSTFGPSSLDITYIFYISDLTNIARIKSEVNFKIKDEFEKNKLDFAFPTQTIEMKK
jgi:MscS family membrane protein